MQAHLSLHGQPDKVPEKPKLHELTENEYSSFQQSNQLNIPTLENAQNFFNLRFVGYVSMGIYQRHFCTCDKYGTLVHWPIVFPIKIIKCIFEAP